MLVFHINFFFFIISEAKKMIPKWKETFRIYLLWRAIYTENILNYFYWFHLCIQYPSHKNINQKCLIFIHILINTKNEYILTYKIYITKAVADTNVPSLKKQKLFLLIVALTSKDVVLWLLLCSSAIRRLGSIKGVLGCWITVIVEAESSNLSPVWPNAYHCWTEASRLGSQR